MIIKTVTCCPICDKETTKKGKNGFDLCSVHSWVKGNKSITVKGRV
ncbi:hypothetical protein KAR91_01125 [Candidatus Pacearchaeota archaeon]|nr:hypothetical protein [Candidatus Pacearchaeota archaeon]